MLLNFFPDKLPLTYIWLKIYLQAQLCVAAVVPDVISCQVRKNILGVVCGSDCWPFFASIGPEVPGAAFVDPCNLKGWVDPCFFNGVDCIDCPPSPLVLLVTQFVVEGHSVGWRFKGSPHVADPVVSAGFKTNFNTLGTQIFSTLNTAVQIVDGSVFFMQTVVDVDFPSIVFESEVPGVAFVGEPHLDLIRILSNFRFLVKRKTLFELHTWCFRFFVDFAGDFVADEVIVEDRPAAFLKSCPGFGLKGVCLCHLST